MQAIGRGRGVNRTPETPLDVDIVADVVLPLAVNEFAYWQPPSEAIEMLVEGIGLTSPVDMVAASRDVRILGKYHPEIKAWVTYTLGNALECRSMLAIIGAVAGAPALKDWPVMVDA